MYKLFIGNKNYSSWSLRPWILMTELGIPFEEQLRPLKGYGNNQHFKSFSPAALVPVLHDGQKVIWDTLAITEYLAERHPSVWAEDADARAWSRCAAAEMHSGFSQLRSICSMNVGLRVKLNERSGGLNKDIARIFELWVHGLNEFKGPFLAGEHFSAVDAFYAPVVYRFRTFGIDMPEEIEIYSDMILSLAGMRAWETEALKEPWREPEHEAEILDVGVILKDHRKP